MLLRQRTALVETIRLWPISAAQAKGGCDESRASTDWAAGEGQMEVLTALAYRFWGFGLAFQAYR